MDFLKLDSIVSKVVALGVPGIVLLVVISTSGLAGAAAIVAALSTLGGPFGMMGGIAALGVIGLISQAIAEFGFESVAAKVLAGYKEQGYSKSKILSEIDGYPITRGLKQTLRDTVNKHF